MNRKNNKKENNLVSGMSSKERRSNVKLHDSDDSFFADTFDYLFSLFYDSLPDEIRKLPFHYMIAVGWAVQLISAVMFGYFFYQQFITGLNQKFLSLDESAGLCVAVLKPMSSSYLADSSGNWEHGESFSYTDAVYYFHANEYFATPEAWAADMADIDMNILYVMSKIGETSTIAYNLVLWTAWSAVMYSNGYAQTVRLTGDARYVFNREYNGGGIGNRNDDCNLQPTVSYNALSGRFQMLYDYSEFQNRSNCTSVLPSWQEFGLSKSTFSLTFDVQSLVVAQAVNYGIFDFDSLTEVEWEGQNSTDSTYKQGFFIDSRYAGMSPIFCIYSYNVSRCMILISTKVYAIPLFNEFGVNESYPEKCNCSDATGTSDLCNRFNFLVGALIFNADANDPLDYLKTMLLGADFKTVNDGAYNAMFAAASPSPTLQDAAFREDAYEFCEVSGVSCSIISINTFGDRWEVNEYYLQLFQASCVNTYYIPGVFTQLGAVPPTALAENYFECTETVWSAMVNSIGVASGTASLFLPLFITTLLWAAHCVRDRRGSEKIGLRKYTQDERDGMLDALALQLLLERDKIMHRHLRSSSLSLEEGEEVTLLGNIVKEAQCNVDDGEGYFDHVASENGLYDMRDSLGLGQHTGKPYDPSSKAKHAYSKVGMVMNRKLGKNKNDSNDDRDLSSRRRSNKKPVAAVVPIEFDVHEPNGYKLQDVNN